MPYNVAWLIQNRVIYVRYFGEIHYKDYEETGSMFARMIDSGEAPVHVVVDASTVTKAPRDIGKIVEYLRGYGRPGIGWVLTVTPNKLERFFAALVMHTFISSLRSSMFGSVEEIPDFLAARDGRMTSEQIAEALKENKSASV